MEWRHPVIALLPLGLVALMLIAAVVGGKFIAGLPEGRHRRSGRRRFERQFGATRR